MSPEEAGKRLSWLRENDPNAFRNLCRSFYADVWDVLGGMGSSRDAASDFLWGLLEEGEDALVAIAQAREAHPADKELLDLLDRTLPRLADAGAVREAVCRAMSPGGIAAECAGLARVRSLRGFSLRLRPAGSAR